jgi:hypothetical protein
MTAETNRQYAYFSVHGDFEPDEISRVVGVPPTESWKKGDLHPRRRLERKQSHWRLRSRLPESAQLELHILDVVEQLDENPSAFEQVSGRFGGCMQLVGYFHDDYPGLQFEQQIVQALARFRLSVDFDFYVLWSDARDET